MIAWYTIANSLLHAVLFPQLMRTSMSRKVLLAVGIPLNVAVCWTLASSLIHLIAGIGMLRQRNWARLLYLGVIPVALALTVGLYGMHPYSVVVVLFSGLFCIILTRPASVAFFRNSASGQERVGK